MAIYHVAISFPLDTALPRDRVSIHPHFVGDNPSGLGNAIKTNLQAVTNIGTTSPFEVKVYDAEKPKPNPPLYTTSQAGATIQSSAPREIAICLSYYSTYNQPRYRGRFYIPKFLISGTAGARPTAQQITDALAWSAVFKNNMPPAHNWVVYSPTRLKADGVTNYWVDDEWDTVRSRGLRGTTRQTGTVP